MKETLDIEQRGDSGLFTISKKLIEVRNTLCIPKILLHLLGIAT